MSSGWLTLLVPLTAAFLLVEVVRRIAHRRNPDRSWGTASAIASRCAWPVWAVTTLVVLELVLPSRLDVGRDSALMHTLSIALIASVTWLIVAVVYALTDVALHKLQRALGTRDNRRARRARTQLLVLRRVVAAVAVVLAVGAILLTFTRVRALGASMLASAGIAGAIAGVAARPTLGNIVAGLQIAFSDMLRIDDVVVVVDGEWGRVDEIALTYVVVRTWDERRLILPSSYFVDNPFQNWTRHESRVIGTVIMLLDFAVPVEEIRAETQRILEDSPLWDRREWVVQVTNICAQGVEIRILMSAADAASAWDLRCDVRERLLTFVRERYPAALPRLRVEAATAPVEIPPEWAERYAGERSQHSGG
jgi:small-conductance mechanosensitive channel